MYTADAIQTTPEVTTMWRLRARFVACFVLARSACDSNKRGDSYARGFGCCDPLRELIGLGFDNTSSAAVSDVHFLGY